MILTFLITAVALIIIYRDIRNEGHGLKAWIMGSIAAIFYAGVISAACFAGALALGEMHEYKWELKTTFELANLPDDDKGIYYISNNTERRLLKAYTKVGNKIQPIQFSSSADIFVKEGEEYRIAELLTYHTTFLNKFHFIYSWPTVSEKHVIHIPVGGVKKI